MVGVSLSGFVPGGGCLEREAIIAGFEDRVAKIPAGKMKARRPHPLPLSEQVVGTLNDHAIMLGTDG
jgi:hypothetical protein